MANRLRDPFAYPHAMLPDLDPSAALQIETPLGAVTCLADPEGVRAITFDAAKSPASTNPDPRAAKHIDRLTTELDDYFNRRSDHFTVPLAPLGTPFQRQVWELLRTIPFGETRSYAWIADQLALPGGSRAVGAANGANPIAIVIPCHRVIRSDGNLCGYAGGVWRKKWLLEHEGAQQPTLFTPAETSDGRHHHSGPPVYRP